MDNRNRLLNEAYRDYNDSLLFVLTSVSNIMRSQTEVQNTYNTNMRSLISLLHTTAVNIEQNHSSLVDQIRSTYPLVSPVRSTISRSTDPVFNNNNRQIFTPRNGTRRRIIPTSPYPITPVSPTRLRLSREFLNEGNNGTLNQYDSITEMMNSLAIGFQSSVPIYPTLRQIQISTRCYNYTREELDEEPDLRCPITREEFNEGEEICVIKHCNHKFKKEPLYQWFNSNVRCPVCRFDIRDHTDSDDEIDINTDISMNPADVDALSDALREAITRVDPNNIVSLELPIPINRTNSGTLSDFFRDLSNNVI